MGEQPDDGGIDASEGAAHARKRAPARPEVESRDHEEGARKEDHHGADDCPEDSAIDGADVGRKREEWPG